jgi:hypothetical protein
MCWIVKCIFVKIWCWGVENPSSHESKAMIWIISLLIWQHIGSRLLYLMGGKKELKKKLNEFLKKFDLNYFLKNWLFEKSNYLFCHCGRGSKYVLENHWIILDAWTSYIGHVWIWQANVHGCKLGTMVSEPLEI